MTNPANKALLDNLLAADEPVKAPARAVLKPKPVSPTAPLVTEAEVPEPTFTPAVTVSPPTEPTPDQLRIKELEHALALARTAALDRKLVTAEEPEYTTPEPPRNADDLIHIVANDFTALGATWFRGQEINIGPGGSYAATLDKFGKSWVDMTDDDQEDRFGEVKFRKGPWRGRPHEERAAKREAARRGGVPQL